MFRVALLVLVFTACSAGVGETDKQEACVACQTTCKRMCNDNATPEQCREYFDCRVDGGTTEECAVEPADPTEGPIDVSEITDCLDGCTSNCGGNKSSCLEATTAICTSALGCRAAGDLLKVLGIGEFESEEQCNEKLLGRCKDPNDTCIMDIPTVPCSTDPLTGELLGYDMPQTCQSSY